MISVWGKLIGIGFGIFGGPVGVGFGLFVGHMVDIVAGEILLRRSLIGFLTDPAGRIPRWFDPLPAVAALAVVAASESDWVPLADLAARFRDSLEHMLFPADLRLAGRLWRRTTRVGPVRYLQAAVRLRTEIHLDTVAMGLTDSFGVEDRKHIINACRVTLAGRSRRQTFAGLRTLAREAAIPESWIAEVLAEPETLSGRPGIDREACELLGVRPEADLRDVKRAYRKLAAQFHPDTAEGLTADQREASSRAFVRITEAYDRVVARLSIGK